MGTRSAEGHDFVVVLAVFGRWLDSIILKVSSNPDDSMFCLWNKLRLL